MSEKLHAGYAKRGSDVIAAHNRELKFARRLEEAALEAHPSWCEIAQPLLVVGNRTFGKVASKGPGTLDGLVKWFERTHPEEVERIKTSIVGGGA